MAVAPPLQPFLKAPNATEPHEVDDGLYNFLSPSLDSIETKKLPKVKEEKEVNMADNSMDTIQSITSSTLEPTANEGSSRNPSDPAGNNPPLPTQPKIVIRSALKQVKPTEWYQKGHHVLDLLKEA